MKWQRLALVPFVLLVLLVGPVVADESAPTPAETEKLWQLLDAPANPGCDLLASFGGETLSFVLPIAPMAELMSGSCEAYCDAQADYCYDECVWRPGAGTECFDQCDEDYLACIAACP